MNIDGTNTLACTIYKSMRKDVKFTPSTYESKDLVADMKKFYEQYSSIKLGSHLILSLQ